MPIIPEGTCLKTEKSTKLPTAPADAGIFDSQGLRKPHSIAAQPKKWRTPNQICSEGITASVTSVRSMPHKNTCIPRRIGRRP